MELKDLAQQISNQCSLHRADVLATLEVMTDAILHYLSLGHSVSLGRLGTFRLSIRSKASEEAKAFSHQNIQQLRMLFLPTPEIKGVLKGVRVNILAQHDEDPRDPGATPPATHDETSTQTDGASSGSGGSDAGGEE